MTPTQPTPEEQVDDLQHYMEACSRLKAERDALLTRQSQERAVREQLRALVEDVIAAQGEGTYPQTDYMGERLRECVAALAASPGKGAEGEAGNG